MCSWLNEILQTNTEFNWTGSEMCKTTSRSSGFCLASCFFVTAGTSPGTFSGSQELFPLRVGWFVSSLKRVSNRLFVLLNPRLVRVISPHENTLKEPFRSCFSSCGSSFYWIVCLKVFSFVYLPWTSSRRAPEPPGPRASSLVPHSPDFWTPETSNPLRQEHAASLSPRPTCISACVYLLSHGEHLALNAVQWLSLSTMTQTYILW